jgi:hypothetical protein
VRNLCTLCNSTEALRSRIFYTHAALCNNETADLTSESHRLHCNLHAETFISAPQPTLLKDPTISEWSCQPSMQGSEAGETAVESSSCRFVNAGDRRSQRESSLHSHRAACFCV